MPHPSLSPSPFSLQAADTPSAPASQLLQQAELYLAPLLKQLGPALEQAKAHAAPLIKQYVAPALQQAQVYLAKASDGIAIAKKASGGRGAQAAAGAVVRGGVPSAPPHGRHERRRRPPGSGQTAKLRTGHRGMRMQAACSVLPCRPTGQPHCPAQCQWCLLPACPLCMWVMSFFFPMRGQVVLAKAAEVTAEAKALADKHLPGAQVGGRAGGWVGRLRGCIRALLLAARKGRKGGAGRTRQRHAWQLSVGLQRLAPKGEAGDASGTGRRAVGPRVQGRAPCGSGPMGCLLVVLVVLLMWVGAPWPGWRRPGKYGLLHKLS